MDDDKPHELTELEKEMIAALDLLAKAIRGMSFYDYIKIQSSDEYKALMDNLKAVKEKANEYNPAADRGD